MSHGQDGGSVRFDRLSIRNLRAIDRFEIDDLKDFIVIAGQNGSGKSSVFDAIRLLKSIYGGYQMDEYMQWFGEFAINVQDRAALRRLFRDNTKPIHISATVTFAESERAYMLENLGDLVAPMAWQAVTGQRSDHWSFSRMAVATQMQQYKEQVDRQSMLLMDAARSGLQSRSQELALNISPDGNILIAQCRPAEIAFQSYQPDRLGVIEYHSASRTYVRQDVGGITLDARQFRDQRRQQALYNWQAKYQNVKTELAASYLRSLIASQAGEAVEEEDLNETLVELFSTFFPDKSYGGVRPLPGGNLEFPVTLKDGSTHDIDDLSSGEKEILYGYLRLRNSTPANSVVLLDEPELHLNPGLLQGYADFYHRHLGVVQGNQLWLVTHSDTLLRQAVGNGNYRVYHMVPAAAVDAGSNQAVEVALEHELDRAAVDLVGDLASYRPHAKVVILEGEGSDGFDVNFVRRLFPDFARRVNLVSGGPKRKVRDLYETLASSAHEVGFKNKFFAICDRDSELYASPSVSDQVFMWDCYHIENYLLVPGIIRAASRALTGVDRFETDAEVSEALRSCAEDIVDGLVMNKVQHAINAELVGSIRLGSPNTAGTPASALLPSIEASARRFTNAISGLTLESLDERARAIRSELSKALAGNKWAIEFPGRLILKRYVDRYLNGVAYEPFRNIILDKAAEVGLRPDGMAAVLNKIQAAR